MSLCIMESYKSMVVISYTLTDWATLLVMTTSQITVPNSKVSQQDVSAAQSLNDTIPTPELHLW